MTLEQGWLKEQLRKCRESLDSLPPKIRDSLRQPGYHAFPAAEVTLAVGRIEEMHGAKLAPDHPALEWDELARSWVNPDISDEDRRAIAEFEAEHPFTTAHEAVCEFCQSIPVI